MDLWGAAAFIGTFILSVYDGRFTIRRMRKYGVIVETNPAVSLGASLFGIPGVYAGTVLPTLGLLIPAFLFSRIALGALFGIRLCLFWFQRASMRFEPDIDRALEARRPASPPHSQGPPSEGT